MHALHIIIVEAEDASDAVEAAERTLGRFEGTVWDWYEVGGRWSDLAPGPVNAYVEPELFWELVRHGIEAQDIEIRDLAGSIGGKTVMADTVEDAMFPIPAHDREGYATRVSESNRQTKAKIDTMVENGRYDQEYGLCGHYLWKFGALMAGYYTFDSHFYDSLHGIPRDSYLRELLEDTPDMAKNIWAVVVDVHN